MKDAIATSTRALAKEVGPLGIRVNGVAPGLIATRFHDTVNTPDGRRATVEKTPLRREGTPGDVAELILFLASDRASFITGEIVHVNGGLGLFQGGTRTVPRSRPAGPRWGCRHRRSRFDPPGRSGSWRAASIGTAQRLVIEARITVPDIARRRASRSNTRA